MGNNCNNNNNNFIYLLSILILNLHSIVCVNLPTTYATPTNVTLSQLLRFNEPLKHCNSNEDCHYGHCRSNGFCEYGYFLCLTDNSPCLYLNSEIFDPINEQLYPPYQNVNAWTSVPILKTCSEEQITGYTCTTETCNLDEDCFSNLCSPSVHACTIKEDKTVVLCQGLPLADTDTAWTTATTFRCGKQNNMACNSHEECFDHFCSDASYCAPYLPSVPIENYTAVAAGWRTTLLLFIMILTISFISSARSNNGDFE